MAARRPRAIYATGVTYLGIDIGSTAAKAAVFDESGNQLAVVRLEYRKPSQGADDWWRTSVRCVRQIGRAHPDLVRGVRAIGLSGRGGTRVILDRGGRPLTLPASGPSPPQTVRRAVDLAGSRRGPHGIRFVAGVLQIAAAHPREYAQAARAMVAKDYLVFQLTGHAVTDPASGPDAERWPEGILHAPEFTHIRLSDVRWPWREAGRLREPVAAQLGLEPGIAVATGAHDGAAAAIGAGAACAGAHPVTLGTNTVYRILSADHSVERNRFWTVLPGLTAYGADVTLGGYALDWLQKTLGATHQRLAEGAASLPAGSEGVVFLPQMNGRILPDPRADAHAVFAGIGRATGREHLYRAVLEGNAFALKAARDALLTQALPHGPVYLTGGGSRSPLWRQILADVFEAPVRHSSVEEGCRGAAMCAAVAAGDFAGIHEAIAAMAGSHRATEPGPNVAVYRAAYERFVSVREANDRA
jgi:xylulokinase